MADPVTVRVPAGKNVSIEPVKVGGRTRIGIHVEGQPVTQFLDDPNSTLILEGANTRVNVAGAVNFAPRIQNDTSGVVEVVGRFTAARESKKGFSVNVNPGDLTKMKIGAAGNKSSLSTPDGTIKEPKDSQTRTLTYSHNGRDVTVGVETGGATNGATINFGNGTYALNGSDTMDRSVASFAAVRAKATDDAATLMNAENGDAKLKADVKTYNALVATIRNNQRLTPDQKTQKLDETRRSFERAHPNYFKDREKAGIPENTPVNDAVAKAPALDAPGTTSPSSPSNPSTSPSTEPVTTADVEKMKKTAKEAKDNLEKLEKDRPGYFDSKKSPNPITESFNAAKTAAGKMVNERGVVNKEMVDAFHANMEDAIKTAKKKLERKDLKPLERKGSEEVLKMLEEYKDNVNKVKGLQDKKTRKVGMLLDQERENLSGIVPASYAMAAPATDPIEAARRALSGMNFTDTSGPEGGGTAVPGLPGGIVRT